MDTNDSTAPTSNLSSDQIQDSNGISSTSSIMSDADTVTIDVGDVIQSIDED